MLTSLILAALLFQTQDATIPPPAAKPLFTTQGRGVQIYQCTQQASVYTWVFQSPDAILLDPISQKQLGTHGAGPTWTWSDGSAILGKVIQKSTSPDSASIPWLLLTATRSGTTTGALTPVQLIRRSDTQGGNAPAAGCDARHADAILRVPYSATYTFYTLP